ncbi:MAG TPA: hypothetical protein VFM70_05275 [Salinimicrobium sp.]|nr:hypothetical protein [Salinimicrobium sp.]
MNDKKDNKALKILIGVLAFALIALGIFTIKFYNEEQENKAILQNEKVALEENLEELLLSYNKAIAENDENKAQLVAARDKIENLLDSIKDMKTDLILLSKFRREISTLKKERDRLFILVDSLNANNKRLTTVIDSTSSILLKQTNLNDSLYVQNKELESKVAIASKINLTKVNANGARKKNNGKINETDRSGRVNNIKTCFTIVKNPLVDAGEKEFYIQVIDPKNNLVGDRFSKTYDDAILYYSTTTKVYYENEDIDVCVLLPIEDPVEGEYFVHIFDGPELLGSTTFKIR